MLEEKQPEKKRHAIIVGIDDYPHIPKLTGAVNDATDMSELLKNFGGFEVDHFLTDEKAKCGAIRKAISDLFWQLNQCDIALFYFSGHGFVDTRGNGYIAPYDMWKDEPLVYGINMGELKQILLDSKNKSCVIMIFDCCYSGIITKGDKSIPNAKSSFDPYFEDLKSGEGKIILASSGGDQTSKETSDCNHVKGGSPHPHGTFTFHLVEGLYGNASDQTGIITLGQLLKYVEKNMIYQKPKFFGAYASMSDIEIAKAADKYNEYIEGRIKAAEDFYSNMDDPTCLILAGVKIYEVQKLNPTNSRVPELKKTIIDSLSTYKDPVNKWLVENQLNIYTSTRYIYPELLRLAGYLSSEKIENIMTLVGIDQAMLANLCKVTKGQLEYDSFIEQCKPFDNPPNIPPKMKQKRGRSI